MGERRRSGAESRRCSQRLLGASPAKSEIDYAPPCIIAVIIRYPSRRGWRGSPRQPLPGVAPSGNVTRARRVYPGAVWQPQLSRHWWKQRRNRVQRELPDAEFVECNLHAWGNPHYLQFPSLPSSFVGHSTLRNAYKPSGTTAIHVNYESESTARSRCWIWNKKKSAGFLFFFFFIFFPVLLRNATNLVIVLYLELRARAIAYTHSFLLGDAYSRGQSIKHIFPEEIWFLANVESFCNNVLRILSFLSRHVEAFMIHRETCTGGFSCLTTLTSAVGEFR